MKDFQSLAANLIIAIGGEANILSVSNCMTRLRFSLKDDGIPVDEAIKKLDGVLGVIRSGGQYQVVLGTTAANLYSEVEKQLLKNAAIGQVTSTKAEARKDKDLLEGGKGGKLTLKKAGNFFNALLNAVSGCMAPVIPILLCAGFAKAICAVFGPQLLNLVTEESAVYVLFNLAGDAGFSFLPVFVGYTAAKKFNCSPVIGLLLGAIMIHPTIIQMASDGVRFNVYGIPAALQNYSSTVIPSILTVWVMSHVEKFFKRFTPDVLKVFGVPFGTLLVMLPVALCITGPIGGFIGKYISGGLISLHTLVGPLALAVLGALFTLLVITGMHPVLFAFLFVSFPQVGFDPFILPAMLLASWPCAGILLACLIKLKRKENRALTIGYFITWLLGGVGEPMIYGLLIPYKKPLYASMIAGFFAGFVGGILGLKAYILSPANGIYGLFAFLGGPARNMIVLLISVAFSVVAGFIIMMLFKINEDVHGGETGVV